MQIFDAEPNTPKGEELELLLVLVKEYENKHIHLPKINTIDAIKLKIDEHGYKTKGFRIHYWQQRQCIFDSFWQKGNNLKTAQKLKNYLQLPAEIFLHMAAKIGIKSQK